MSDSTFDPLFGQAPVSPVADNPPAPGTDGPLGGSFIDPQYDPNSPDFNFLLWVSQQPPDVQNYFRAQAANANQPAAAPPAAASAPSGPAAPAAGQITVPAGTTVEGLISGQILSQYPDKAWMLQDPELGPLLAQATQEGWSSDQLQAHVIGTNWWKVHGAAQTVNQLKAERDKWLVPMSDQALTDYATKLATGQIQPGEFLQQMQNQAKTFFNNASLSSFIDNGGDVKSYLDPYVQHAATLLGVTPDSIDPTAPKWLAAIQQKDPKTGANTSLSLNDWETKIRSDASYGWQDSANGKAAAFDMVNNLSKAMGVRA